MKFVDHNDSTQVSNIIIPYVQPCQSARLGGFYPAPAGRTFSWSDLASGLLVMRFSQPLQEHAKPHLNPSKETTTPMPPQVSLLDCQATCLPSRPIWVLNPGCAPTLHGWRPDSLRHASDNMAAIHQVTRVRDKHVGCVVVLVKLVDPSAWGWSITVYLYIACPYDQ